MRLGPMMRTFSSTAHLDLDYGRNRGAMTLMWKAAAAFILAIGAGGFVAGSVLGDSGGSPDVGEPVVLNNDGARDPRPNGPTTRPTDDDGTPDQGGSNDDDGDDDDPDTVYHEPDDLDDDGQGRGRGRGRGGDDDRGDNSGPGSDNSGSGSDNSGSGSGGDDDGGDDDHGDDDGDDN
jgi:hypothetical protein